MGIKTQIFKQICWAWELFWSFFCIDYCQQKTNAAVNAILYSPKKSQTQKQTLKDENIQILHCLQILPTKTSVARLSLSSFSTQNNIINSFLPTYQGLICETYILLRLYLFWTYLLSELTPKEPYQMLSIWDLTLRLLEL